MLFHFSRPDESLVRELRAAVAGHRAQAVRWLLESHGPRALGDALADLSGPVIDDALSMLPAAEGLQVLKRLPHAARRRMHEARYPVRHEAPAGVLLASGFPLVRVR